MSPLKRRLLEDRAMRDAARDVVTSDVDFLKSDVETQGVGSRMAESGSNFARLVADGATDLAANNKGKVGAGFAIAAAGIAAWLFRKPIMEAIDGFLDEMHSGDDPEDERETTPPSDIPNED